MEPFSVQSWCGVPLGCHRVPESKLDPIFRLMRTMTDYYGVPHLFPTWATGLARREALGSTAIGQGLALVHQFQDDGFVKPKDGSVDWWLFLFPDGIEWEAMDNEPVFGMIAHVFSPHLDSPGIKLRAWSLATCVGRNIVRSTGGLDWARIASMDRPLAAQLVNR